MLQVASKLGLKCVMSYGLQESRMLHSSKDSASSATIYLFDPNDPQVVQKIVDVMKTERKAWLEYIQNFAILKELEDLIKNP
mgnify:FL=1